MILTVITLHQLCTFTHRKASIDALQISYSIVCLPIACHWRGLVILKMDMNPREQEEKY
jgi:hypothetical protein